MSNLVEFLVKVRDLASAPLVKLAGTGSRSFAKLDKGIFGTGSKIEKLGGTVQNVDRKLNSLGKPRNVNINTSGISKASNEVDRLNSKLDKTNRSLNSKEGIGSGNSGKSSNLFGMPVGLRRLLGGAAIGAMLTGVAGAGMERDATNMRFDVLAGKSEGGKLSKNLTDYANKSIYGNEVFNNAQTMLAFDINAKKVMPTINMLGDVAMGNAERMGALTLAFSQVNAAGRLTGQDLLQFVNAGFNPLQEISKKTGKSMADLRQEMSDGKITYKMVEDSFKQATSAGGRFYNMTEKLNKTPFGKWEALKGSLAGLSADVGLSWNPFLNGLFDAGNSVIKFVADNRDRLGSLFDPLLASANPLRSIFDDISDRVGNLSNPESLNSIFSGVKSSLDFLAPTLTQMSGVLKSLYSVSVQLGESYNKSGGFKDFVDTAALGAGKLYQGTTLTLGTSAKNLIGGIGDHASAILEGRWDKYDSGARKLGYALNGDPKIDNQINGIFGATSYDQLLNAANPEALTRDSKEQRAYANSILRKSTVFPGAPIKPGESITDLWARGMGNSASFLDDQKASGVPAPASAADTAKGISGGGIRNLTINVGKFFEDLHFQSGSTDTGVKDIEDKFLEMFLRVVNSANAATS